MNYTTALLDKRLLVCGGCGFMGSNFIHYALAHNPRIRIINLDLLTYAGNPDNLIGVPRARYHFVKGDIANIALVKRLMRKADIVVNFAAETHVDRSIHGHADEFLHSNVLGVQSLLETLRVSPTVERMIHVSTDEVWGDLPLHSKKKFNERSPFLPNSPYAASKAAGDLLIRSYVKTYGLPVIITHSVNNFGPRQFPEKLIPFFTLRALADKPLPLYGDGRNVRDWISVDDHSAAIMILLVHGALGEAYAISHGEEYANKDIARRILRLLGKPHSLITYVTDRPGHDRRYSVNSAKIRSTGWQPRHSLDTTLTKTVDWYRNNPRWIARALRHASGINTHIALP